MQSEFRKDKTLGTQVLETQSEHERSSPVEAMELAHEGGKSYMKELIETIASNRGLVDEYYIQVFCTKERMFHSRPVIYFRFCSRLTAPAMHAEQDLWYVNNSLDKLELLWSLPQEEMMDVLLADPDIDPQLENWIKFYKKP